MKWDQTAQSKRPCFFQITIQEKGDGDFRSFCHCTDADGDKWELRGYGASVEEAASDAWACYTDEDWETHGYIVKSFE